MRSKPQSIVIAGLLLFLISGIAQSATSEPQRYVIDLNEESAAGTLLRHISVESDDAARMKLLESFLVDYANHKAVYWVTSQLFEQYVAAKKNALVLNLAAKMLDFDPADLGSANKALTAAKELNNPAAISKWMARCVEISNTYLKAPKPSDPAAVEAWQRRRSEAQQVMAHAEYNSIVEIHQMADPKNRIAMIDAFILKSPYSTYREQLVNMKFYSHLQLGEKAKALAIAQEQIQLDDTNEDMLLLVAESNFSKSKDSALKYATKVTDLVDAKKEPPNGMSPAEWAKKRASINERAHWLIGQIASEQGRYGVADRSLRIALPGLKGDSAMLGSALFQLGWANYKMGKYSEALKFNQQCLAVASPYQDAAKRNLQVIRSEAAGQ